MPALNLTLKFSASRASKYHNCHASANLEEAIPGFRFDEKERAAAKAGTIMHKVFEEVINQVKDLLDAAHMLREIADVFGKNRTLILKDEKEYLVWWFMKEKRAPVLEHRYLAPLVWQIPAKKKPATKTKAEYIPAEGEMQDETVSPAALRFLAEALEYIADILVDGGEILTEAKAQALWLETKPSTTVDVLIRQGEMLWVIDLKTGSIPVTAIGNEQLMHYGLTFLGDEKLLTLLILQPKNVEAWTITREQLLVWGDEVRESEAAILSGDVTFNPGSYCEFCPANPTSRGERGFPSCPARVELLYGASDDRQDDESILSDDEE